MNKKDSLDSSNMIFQYPIKMNEDLPIIKNEEDSRSDANTEAYDSKERH